MSLAALRGGVRLSSLQRGHAAALGNGITRSQCRRLTVLNKFSGFDELLREKQSKRGGGFGGGRRRVRTKNGRVLLEPGVVSPPLEVPESIPRPSYSSSGRAPPFSDSYQYAADEEKRERMRQAGALAAKVRDYAGTLVKPGVTTDEIDKAVHQMIIDAGAYPSPLNYGSFPKSVCTSVNECICHGIPDDRELVDGDIINIDVTVFLNGVHGDTSRTFYCGEVSEAAKKLVRGTRESLEAAIAIVKPEARLCDIGNEIQKVADKYGYGVVKNYVGHGVGEVFHSGPVVQHQANRNPGVLKKGMTFTIEPMLVDGPIAERSWRDGWTIVTADGSLTAQFEHTLLVTDDGVEILTPYGDNPDFP